MTIGRRLKLPIRRILLHGSHAKGTANHTSDYDLVLVTEPSVSIKARTLAAGQMMFELGQQLVWPVDVVVTTEDELNGKKFPLLNLALESGYTIFDTGVNPIPA